MLTESPLDTLTDTIRQCQLCADHLPFGPRPVLRAHRSARILIIGQAPGTKVHETGIPWNDASGNRLRQWMGVDHETFYDESRIAIMPMGFCYPGQNINGGDAPPRPECAPAWHAPLLELMPDIKLTLLVGGFAQKYYLGDAMKKTMTATVRQGQEYGAVYLPLPHPSWRNTAWLRKNPWFETDILPVLRQRLRTLV